MQSFHSKSKLEKISENFLQDLFAERIGGRSFGKNQTLYKFQKIKLAKQQAQKMHPTLPLIDLGVGEPDAMAFPETIENLYTAAKKHTNRVYADNGALFFKEAVAHYMQSVFNVSLQPENEIVHCIGAKSALAMAPLCFINPGDYAIITAPGYPIFGTHTHFLGGQTYSLPLSEENNFLPDLNVIPLEILKKAKVIVLNYPNNPTGACATFEFFKKVIDFAKEHHLIVIHDAAYATLTYHSKPLSILQVPGALDVALEIHSLSKSFNMTGWRLGWVCGNSTLIKAFCTVKDTTDSGQFLAIQEAGSKALRHHEHTKQIRDKYQRRLNQLVSILQKNGFQIKPSEGTFFLYCRSPKSVSIQGQITFFENAEAFSQWLILDKLISTVPWDDAGSYIRWSVTFEAPSLEDEINIFKTINNRLANCTFEF